LKQHPLLRHQQPQGDIMNKIWAASAVVLLSSGLALGGALSASATTPTSSVVQTPPHTGYVPGVGTSTVKQHIPADVAPVAKTPHGGLAFTGSTFSVLVAWAAGGVLVLFGAMLRVISRTRQARKA
jgi:hypothetical protein